MFGRILFFLFLASAFVANAEVATDLAPINCAWSKLSPAQQERLRDGFTIDNSGPERIFQFVQPSPEQTQAAAAACQLSYDAAQLAELRPALAAKSGEEVARMGIANRGLLKPDIVDRAMEKMHAGNRKVIGDTLACPGSQEIKRDWDRSVFRAMRRTNIKIVDGRTVSLISIAMLWIMKEEGHIRRINGTAPPCDT